MLRRGGASAPAPATFDFTAGGLIPAANCIQAFDPYIVQDLAQSYVDLSGHGNNAAVTVPPTLDELGWSSNGVDQFIDTGLVPEIQYSIFIHYTYAGEAGQRVICGVEDGMYIIPWVSGSSKQFFYNWTGKSASRLPMACVSGVVGAETSPGSYGVGYTDGLAVVAIGEPGFVSETGATMLIFALNDYLGVPKNFIQAIVSRWAVYDIPLSAAQAAALSTAMAVS